jgi:hypothetical protein
METQQKELDLMESIQTTHARSFVQKFTYNKGKMTATQKSQLTDPNNTLVELDEESGLRALENPTVNQTVPMTTSQIIQDMTKISGVSEYDTSVIPKTETTLGEAQMVQGSANNRKEDDKRQVEDFVRRVMNKLFQVVQQYMTEDICIQIAGEGKTPADWITKTPEQIQGEYDFDIQPNSASPVNKNQLRQDNILLYKTFNQDLTIPVKGRNQLRKWVLESFDKKDDSLFDTQIDETSGLDGNQPTVDENGQPIDAVSAGTPPPPPAPVAPPEPSPLQKISESISYKDLPEDVKRQIEAEAGLQPSQMAATPMTEPTPIKTEGNK